MTGWRSLQARALRRLYLTLFLRGRGSRGRIARAREGQSLSRRLAGILVTYAVVGVTAVIAVQPDTFLTSFYLHAMGMLFASMFLAASAGEMIFNKDEAEILGHRPVDPGLLLWAKASVLVQVSTLIAIAYSVAGSIRAISSGRGGLLFPFVHAFSASVAAIFGASVVVLLYQLCLRFFGRRRLDNVMAGAQVALTIAVILCSQLIRPMATGHVVFSNLEEAWWPYFTPPAWFAGLDVLLTGQGDLSSVALSLIGLIATGAVAYLAFGRLAASAHRSAIAASFDSAPVETRGPAGPSGEVLPARPWLASLAAAPPFSLVLRHPAVRSAFLLCGAYMLRDRDTKLRLYPGVASVFVMPLVFAFGGIGDKSSIGFAISSAYVGLIPLMAVNLLQFSQDWRAADVFRLAPGARPGHFVFGALAAIAVMLVTPACLLVIGAAAVHGGTSPQNFAALLPGLVALPASLFLAGALCRSVPLSRPNEEAQSAGRGVKMIGMVFASILIGATGGLALEHGHLPAYLAVEILLSAACCALAARSIYCLVWEPAE